MKATHQGECQCCGKIQKLPKGVLSQHGYTVRWNSFNGTCKGTGHQPYEQSCALIGRFILSAQLRVADITVIQAALNQPATEPKGWYHEYVRDDRTGKSGYQWREVALRLRLGQEWIIEYEKEEGKWRRLELYEYGWKTVLDAATILNKRRATSFEAEKSVLNQYIEWQQERVANWQLRALQPVKED